MPKNVNTVVIFVKKWNTYNKRLYETVKNTVLKYSAVQIIYSSAVKGAQRAGYAVHCELHHGLRGKLNILACW